MVQPKSYRQILIIDHFSFAAGPWSCLYIILGNMAAISDVHLRLFVACFLDKLSWESPSTDAVIHAYRLKVELFAKIMNIVAENDLTK